MILKTPFCFDERSKERSFNHIHLKNRLVTKTCGDSQKGQHEVAFYQYVPSYLKKYFPTLVESGFRNSRFQYSTTLIEKSDIGHLYNKNLVTLEFFENFLAAVKLFFDQCPPKITSEKKWREILDQTILQRINQRWNQYQATEIFPEIKKALGEKYLLDFFSKINDTAADWVKHSTVRNLRFCHGDLCFSNILFSESSGLHLVDPRGGANIEDSYLPSVYDLAKLSQCVFGNYDGILNNNAITFDSQRQLFKTWIEKNFDFSFNETRLIEAVHLLCLLPLHKGELQLQLNFIKAAETAYADGILWQSHT